MRSERRVEDENREQVLVWEIFNLIWHASHSWYLTLASCLTWFTIINSAIFTSSRSKHCTFQSVLLCMWKALNTGLKNKTHWCPGSCPHKRWKLIPFGMFSILSQSNHPTNIYWAIPVCQSHARNTEIILCSLFPTFTILGLGSRHSLQWILDEMCGQGIYLEKFF